MLECARTSAFAAAHRTVPAGAPSARAPSQLRRSRRGVTSPVATGSLSQHRAKQQESLHSGVHFASCSVELLLARSILTQEPAAAILQGRRQPNLGSGCSGAEPPRVENACARRPLGTPAPATPHPHGTAVSLVSCGVPSHRVCHDPLNQLPLFSKRNCCPTGAHWVHNCPHWSLLGA